MWNISLKIFVSCFGLALWLGLPTPAEVQSQEREKDMAARGQYIFAVAGGCACHTVPKGTPHVGAREFPIPMAKVYSTNLTADKETGLGGWSDQQIHDAMVKGLRPNGDQLIPAMPYEAYSGMAHEDLKALVSYLRTLKPVSRHYG
ncbi:MAG: c-type cytochrome [Deltaproteobacteria bacterium]|nr:c-type cytochrome [Deltaproteobacteria bacterium]